jgi:hypothetical protein
MSKKLFLPILLLSLSSLACEDNGSELPQPPSIQGKWTLSKIEGKTTMKAPSGMTYNLPAAGQVGSTIELKANDVLVVMPTGGSAVQGTWKSMSDTSGKTLLELNVSGIKSTIYVDSWNDHSLVLKHNTTTMFKTMTDNGFLNEGEEVVDCNIVETYSG